MALICEACLYCVCQVEGCVTVPVVTACDEGEEDDCEDDDRGDDDVHYEMHAEVDYLRYRVK